jgi:hypothetical protein
MCGVNRHLGKVGTPNTRTPNGDTVSIRQLVKNPEQRAIGDGVYDAFLTVLDGVGHYPMTRADILDAISPRRGTSGRRSPHSPSTHRPMTALPIGASDPDLDHRHANGIAQTMVRHER